jgi:hypothetical protein
MSRFSSLSKAANLALGLSVAFVSQAFADANAGVFDGSVSSSNLRTGNIGFDDIPKMILAATNFFLGFAGTVSVVMIIYGAFRLSMGSIESDKDTAKKIITASILGFVLSVSSWGIIKIVMTNL